MKRLWQLPQCPKDAAVAMLVLLLVSAGQLRFGLLPRSCFILINSEVRKVLVIPAKHRLLLEAAQNIYQFLKTGNIDISLNLVEIHRTVTEILLVNGVTEILISNIYCLCRGPEDNAAAM